MGKASEDHAALAVKSCVPPVQQIVPPHAVESSQVTTPLAAAARPRAEMMSFIFCGDWKEGGR